MLRKSLQPCRNQREAPQMIKRIEEEDDDINEEEIWEGMCAIIAKLRM